MGSNGSRAREKILKEIVDSLGGAARKVPSSIPLAL
jgi:hypothetical protein